MNTQPIYPQPDVGRMLQIEIHGARRAHHAYLQLKRHAWIGPAWRACADLAAADRDIHLRSARKHSLARVNGRDQPVSARGPCPKTPAAGERVCRVAAVGGNAGDTFARATLRQQHQCEGVA